MRLKNNRTVLDDIVERARQRVSADKLRSPVDELKKRIGDAPPVASFSNAIASSFGLIAEIKRRSPSQGAMRAQDTEQIARIYDAHPFVKAVSVLTNRDDFGMSIEDFKILRGLTRKPILRKDFIFDEYQIYEARAYGADAILLMANVVTDAKKLHELFELSKWLGMDVLFECRTEEEIAAIPTEAKIIGINYLILKARKIFWFSRYTAARVLRHLGVPDRSIEHDSFDLSKHIPAGVLRVAESGVSRNEIGLVRDQLRYNAALIGTAILNAPEGVKASLDAFSGISAASSFNALETRHGGRHIPA